MLARGAALAVLLVVPAAARATTVRAKLHRPHRGMQIRLTPITVPAGQEREVCQAIEPLLTLARETEAHVMLVHHCGKAERVDATDAILGSTAIFGGVDSALILKRSDRYRTLQSSQKYGIDWPETVLEFDSERRALSLGVEKSEAEADRISQGILDYLRGSEEPRTREEIEAQVEGKTGPARKALRLLVEGNKIIREGTGRRGDPFKYRFLFPCSPEFVQLDSCSFRQ